MEKIVRKYVIKSNVFGTMTRSGLTVVSGSPDEQPMEFSLEQAYSIKNSLNQVMDDYEGCSVDKFFIKEIHTVEKDQLSKEKIEAILAEVKKNTFEVDMSSWDTWTEPAIMVDKLEEILKKDQNNGKNV